MNLDFTVTLYRQVKLVSFTMDIFYLKVIFVINALGIG